MIVLDTNVVSELMKEATAPEVSRWVREANPEELHTTSVTLAEVLYGVARLPDGSRKEKLRASAEAVFDAFRDRVLPFDTEAAEHYPSIVDDRDRLGVPISGFDAQIASICRLHSAALSTRNVRDFVHTGLVVIDPWHGG